VVQRPPVGSEVRPCNSRAARRVVTLGTDTNAREIADPRNPQLACSMQPHSETVSYRHARSVLAYIHVSFIADDSNTAFGHMMRNANSPRKHEEVIQVCAMMQKPLEFFPVSMIPRSIVCGIRVTNPRSTSTRMTFDASSS